jgi:hypothetical protein
MNDFGLYLVMTDPVVGYAKCAEAAVEAGVKIIQLRMKHASREDILREAREVRRATAGSDTLFIVNDDPAIAAEAGAEGVLLDLGGNLKAVSGSWTTGIRDPGNPSGIAERIVLTNGMACATSGEYVRGKHIYDGRTGRPVTNAVASVTVVHPSSAMLADALSTTLFVLGREEGEVFLRRFYPEARAYWIMRR